MRAVVISAPGGPQVLELRRLTEPSPGPEEVRVDVRATALNRADLLQRRGLYPAPPGVPADVPGLEFAGEVEICGARVASLAPGDRVMGIVGGGAYAEKLVVHERLCLPVPPGLSWEQAAAIPEAFLTAFDAFERGALAAGETVLLHAAGSGVGTAAAQLARAAGARVIGTARDAGKRRRLRGLGVDPVLDPAGPDLAEQIRLAAGATGVALVLELVGAPTWALDVAVLGRGGRIVLVGLLGGGRAEVDLLALMRKQITIRGTVLRSRPVEEKIALVRAFARRILPLLADGRVAPVVDRVLPLDEVVPAHQRMEQNANLGKIVLRVG